MKGMKCDGCDCMVFRTDIPFTSLQPASFFFLLLNHAPLSEHVEKNNYLHLTMHTLKKKTTKKGH